MSKSPAKSETDFHNKYVFYRSPKKQESPENPRQPILLSQGIFDKQFEHSQITPFEQKHKRQASSPKISPSSTILPTNLILPVKMMEADCDSVSSAQIPMKDVHNLKQQEEPLDDSPNEKTAQKICLF
jgi:hypothetical protein